MKQSQLDTSFVAHGDDLFLRFVELPRGGEAAGLLRGIGVADHHFDAAARDRTVSRVGQQPAHRFTGAAKIVDRLEQRNDAHLVLQSRDVEYILGLARHRDDIRAQTFGRRVFDEAERVAIRLRVVAQRFSAIHRLEQRIVP